MKKIIEDLGKSLQKDIEESFVRFIKTLVMMGFSVGFLLLPIILGILVEPLLGIEYNKYIELLKIIANSWYIVVVAVICIVFYFGKELSEKIMQITSISNIMKFNEPNKKENITEKVSAGNTTIEENEENEITRKIKEDFLQKEDSQPQQENISQEENMESEDLKVKNNLLILENTKLRMSKLTEFVLRNVFFENGIFKSFSYDDIEKYLKELRQIAPDIIKRRMLKKEIENVIIFLTTSGIVETEDDIKFDITEFGRTFMRYVFEGGI